MTITYQFFDEDRIKTIKHIKEVHYDGGLITIVDNRNLMIGSINPEKCTILKIESEANTK